MPEPYVPPRVPNSADVADLTEPDVKTRHYDPTEIRLLRIQGEVETKRAPLHTAPATHQSGELTAEPPTRLEIIREDSTHLLVSHERVSVQRPNTEPRTLFDFRQAFCFTLSALAVTASALLFWPAPAELKPTAPPPLTATSPPPVDQAATAPSPGAVPPPSALASPARKDALPHPTPPSAVEPRATQTPRQAAVFLLDGHRSKALQVYAEIARRPGAAPVFRVIATQLKTLEASH